MNWTKKDKAHVRWIVGFAIKLLVSVTSLAMAAKITPETTWAQLANPYFAVPAIFNIGTFLWAIFSRRFGDVAKEMGE